MQKLGFTGGHGRQRRTRAPPGRRGTNALQGGDAAAQARFTCLIAMLEARGRRLNSTAFGPDVYGSSCMS